MRKKVTEQDASADHLVVFQEKAIRRTLHDDEWWFVITDIVAALTDAADPSDYWKKMRRRDPDLSLDSQGGGQIDPPLAFDFETAGGRQKLQCWNTQGIFRLIQSIPSPKAEPFKRWLAKVGKERLMVPLRPLRREGSSRMSSATRLRPPRAARGGSGDCAGCAGGTVRCARRAFPVEGGASLRPDRS